MNNASPVPELDPDANPASVARAIVLRQLTHSPKSRFQLSQKLAERHIPEDVAEAVLDRFEAVKLIDDAEFAQMWVRSRSLHKSLARGALKRELAEKGIDPHLAQDALDQIDDDTERQQAKELVRKKLRGSIDLSERSERDKYTRRWVAMLARKGFNPGTAFEVVAQVIDEYLEDV
ncbi:RecX family transcriptional regulator [Arthrobacter alpinus]|uniref:regulatory protein RecX n=1 Tax=Arthrobacter alpinus TaxID=656366 RepID=UPI0005C8CAF1|nr:regulatory protein RecX [Arthrobacter alpinus]ALV44786.1 RecX family transcriptional regulator [Arthrobacter alpinus]